MAILQCPLGTKGIELMNAKELEKKVTDLLRKWGFLPPKLAPRPIPIHPRRRSPSRQRY